jgi:hypothetical protein
MRYSLTFIRDMATIEVKINLICNIYLRFIRWNHVHELDEAFNSLKRVERGRSRGSRDRKLASIFDTADAIIGGQLVYFELLTGSNSHPISNDNAHMFIYINSVQYSLVVSFVSCSARVTEQREMDFVPTARRRIPVPSEASPVNFQVSGLRPSNIPRPAPVEVQTFQAFMAAAMDPQANVRRYDMTICPLCRGYGYGGNNTNCPACLEEFDHTDVPRTYPCGHRAHVVCPP